MSTRRACARWLPVACGVLGWLAPAAPAAPADVKGAEFFEAKIRPVLVAHCFECHSAKAAKVRGGLLLDTRAGLREGGDNGAAVVPGDPDKSLLIQALRHDGMKMPPKKDKLPDDVIADFVAWVKMGAPDPRAAATGKGYKRMTPEEAKRFWSFQPPKKAAPPHVRRAGWARNDIDTFV